LLLVFLGHWAVLKEVRPCSVDDLYSIKNRYPGLMKPVQDRLAALHRVAFKAECNRLPMNKKSGRTNSASSPRLRHDSKSASQRGTISDNCSFQP
jgi:hypothetical protein